MTSVARDNARERRPAPDNEQQPYSDGNQEAALPPGLASLAPTNDLDSIMLASDRPAPASQAPKPEPHFQYNAGLHPLSPIDTQRPPQPSIGIDYSTPLSAELRLQTKLPPPQRTDSETKEKEFGQYAASPPLMSPDFHHYRSQMGSAGGDGLPARTSSVKSLAASTRSLSPSSMMSSPGMGPLAEITPLPSPLGSKNASWVDLPTAALCSPLSPVFHAGPGHSPTSPAGPALPQHSSPPRKRKAYPGIPHGLPHGAGPPDQGSSAGILNDPLSRARSQSNRSLSEYLPGANVPRPRNVAVSNHHAPAADKSMQREEYVAAQRGIATPTTAPPQRPPTPPRSNRSAADSESDVPSDNSPVVKPSVPVHYEATMVRSGAVKQWTGVRQLGVGTFSTVMLATSESEPVGQKEANLHPKSLVAVKICEHGPAGGADEKKIESSLKRELEILKSINHPSLVHLRAVSVVEKRAFLVLNYSAGGDMFELASLKLHLLVPALTRRIFAELAHAVAYLHSQQIVHRDIKLENVLINPPLSQLPHLNPTIHPHPIVTLTDLGLGRYMPQPPHPPTLTTRCGSEDYAAPELLMGQGYDGRQTDSWALGVLLYALLEGRLPFDPVPGARRQSPTSHRIARCEWQWNRWGDVDGDWDGGETTAQGGATDKDKFKQWGRELGGARTVVEGLLKRVSRRWGLDKVLETEWVRGGIEVEGGLRREAWEEE